MGNIDGSPDPSSPEPRGPAPSGDGLLRAAWDREDTDALAAAIEPMLRRVWLPELAQEDDRGDVIQQALLAMVRRLASTGLETWGSLGSLLKWLLETLRNEAHASSRRAWGRKKREGQDEEALRQSASSDWPSETLLAEWKEEILAKLPQDLRDRFLRLVDGDDPERVYEGLPRRKRSALRRLFEDRTRECLGLRKRPPADPRQGK